jgi:hypothetical protein
MGLLLRYATIIGSGRAIGERKSELLRDRSLVPIGRNCGKNLLMDGLSREGNIGGRSAEEPGLLA